MDAGKIVMREVDCHHLRVVRRLFRESVAEARHVPVAHPDI